MKELIVHKIPALMVLCGPPASGKSTFVANYEISPRPYIISMDAMRKEWLGDESDQSHNRFIWQRAMQRLEWYCNSNKLVIFDATNVKSSGRRFLVKKAKEVGIPGICVYFYPSLEECKRRNQLRERHVPDEVIERMYKQFSRPTTEEGWDLIIKGEDYERPEEN